MRFMILILLAFVATACTPTKNAIQKLGEEVGIFSNRPQTFEHFIAVVKLKNPALLENAVMKNGKAEIDAELEAAIVKEQEETILKLKELSSEIKVLYRYKLVLNGLAVVAPLSVQDKLKAMTNVAYVESSGEFARPQIVATSEVVPVADLSENSGTFIGATKVHKLIVNGKPVDGKGMKVGIIDTGIDYTHAQLGGVGTEEAFKSVNPDLPNSMYPNAKVVGGIDLVGTQFNSASGDFSKRIPIPDENPLDEGGHGTHVAGTVAGIGDNVNTYDGMAPEADLYAIKVFGADGSTGDAVVVAALEYAAAQNLDVVNLSLGSPYGNPHILYQEAAKNLVNGGTVMVASAGNSGPQDYIVGAPSVVEDAISVAASIDNMPHNWQFRAVKFVTPTAGELKTEAVESSMAKPIAESNVSGKFVFIGLANAELSDELKAQLKGNVALIDRGAVTFEEKLKRAFAAGTIGAVVVQNKPEAPFGMGGGADTKLDGPAIMIPLSVGDAIKEQMKLGDVVIHFNTPDKINKPELIDTLTGFSSKGPRSIDALIKPEISAPGEAVISAAMGKGKAGVKFSGTSMAGPHVAGVMAILKQNRPDLTPAELKSVLLGRAVTIGDAKKNQYQISRQGAGRVDAYQSATAEVVSQESTLSLGEHNLVTRKMLRKTVVLKNITQAPLDLSVVFEGNTSLKVTMPSAVQLPVGETKELKLSFTIEGSELKDPTTELDGFIKLKRGNEEVLRIPVLAVVTKISAISAGKLSVHSTEVSDSAGAAVDLELKNNGTNAGDVLLFNLLGQDTRKLDPTNSTYKSRACDMQAAGYRIIEKTVGDKKVKVLQVAAKIYEAMTTWNACELSVLIDQDQDGVADQELAGIALENVKGLGTPAIETEFYSVLLDAPKARSLRKAFELASALPPDPQAPALTENYAEALVDMMPMRLFNNSTVIMIEADVTKLAATAAGELSVQVATVHNEASSVEVDDYLGTLANWHKISLEEGTQSFTNLPESLTVNAKSATTVELTKGEGTADLLILMPSNRKVQSNVQTDQQSAVVKPEFN